MKTNSLVHFAEVSSRRLSKLQKRLGVGQKRVESMHTETLQLVVKFLVDAATIAKQKYHRQKAEYASNEDAFAAAMEIWTDAEKIVEQLFLLETLRKQITSSLDAFVELDQKLDVIKKCPDCHNPDLLWVAMNFTKVQAGVVHRAKEEFLARHSITTVRPHI